MVLPICTGTVIKHEVQAIIQVLRERERIDTSLDFELLHCLHFALCFLFVFNLPCHSKTRFVNLYLISLYYFMYSRHTI